MISCITDDTHSGMAKAGMIYGDIIKWKHFPCHWPFVWGIHRSPVNSPHKGQWCRALMFSLMCAWTNGSTSNQDASDLRHLHAHYNITVTFDDILKMANFCYKKGFLLYMPIFICKSEADTVANNLTFPLICGHFQKMVHILAKVLITRMIHASDDDFFCCEA